jgi:Protein of unknown function (DUF3465)
MKKLTTLGIALLLAVFGYYQQRSAIGTSAQQTQGNAVDHTVRGSSDSGSAIEQAIQQRSKNVQLTIQATVKKTLSDDNEGSRHQRFLVELPSGGTVLVAHNIDLAERVANLRPGQQIELHGEYVWNDRGGVMHWTHHDPAGRHADGWIKYNGRTYR